MTPITGVSAYSAMQVILLLNWGAKLVLKDLFIYYLVMYLFIREWKVIIA